MSELLIPVRLPPRYRVEATLKEGPSTCVLIVVDAVDDRRKAIKTLRFGSIEPQHLLQFKSEVRTLASLRHPNVVEVFEFGMLEGGSPYFAMEFVEGKKITDWFDGSDWTSLYDVIFQIAAGLHHVHHHGIIHLDIKPSNVLIEESGRAKLMDFGVASTTSRLFERTIRGTLHYMAPEVLRQERVDPRADLYSLGMTLYETVTGALPTYGKPQLDIIRTHLDGDFRRPASINPNVPRRLEKIILKLLERDPRHRYPSAAALYRDVAGAAGRDTTGTDLIATDGELLAAPLIGRDEEVARILEKVENARRGEGGGLLIVGSEGMGKSRIVQDAALLAQLDSARVFSGRCPVNRKSIYAPFFEIFQQMVRAMNPDSDPGEELRRILRSVESKSGSDVRRSEKYRLFNRIAHSLQDFYGYLDADRDGNSALILIIEDVQWADPATADLLTFLVGEAHHSNLVVIGTHSANGHAEQSAREAEEPQPRIDWLQRARETGIEVIEVGELSEESIREYVEALLGTNALPGDFIKWVVWESGGVPLLIRRSIEYLLAHDCIEWHAEGWRVEMDKIRSIRIPGGAAAAWSARLDSLEPESRHVLQYASVLGERFEIGMLTEILEGDPDDVYAQVRELTRLQILDEAPEGSLFTFPQLSLREGVYASMPERERSDAHRRAAAVLEERYDAGGTELLGQLAYHYGRSDEHAKGIEFAIRAGEQASAAMSHVHASDFFRIALELMDVSGDESRKLEIREKLGEACEASRDYRGAMQAYQYLLKSAQTRSESREGPGQGSVMMRIGRVLGRRFELDAALSYFQSALELIDDDANPADGAEICGRMAEMYQLKGDLEEAEACVKRAVDFVREHDDSRIHAFVRRIEGQIAYARNDWSGAETILGEALEIALRSGDSRLARLIRSDRGNVLWKLGRWNEALEHYRVNQKEAEAEDDLWELLRANNRLARIELGRGEFSIAAALFEKSLRIDEKLSSPEDEAFARMNLGQALEMMGQWSEALDCYHRCLGIEGFDETHPSRVAVYIPLARLTSKLGDLPKAMHYAQTAYEAARKARDGDLMAEAAFVLAQIERERENFDEADELLATAARFFEENDAPHGCARAYVRMADLLLRGHSLEEAAEKIEMAASIVERLGDRYTLAQTEWVRGKIDLFRSNRDEATKRFGEASMILEDLDAPYDLGRLSFDLGLLLEDAEEASEEIRKAIGIFERLHASLDLERARGALFRISPSGRSAPKSAVVGLYEIVKLINSTVNLDELLNRVLDIVIQRLHAERATIVLIDPITQTPRTRVTRSSAETEEEESRSPQWIIQEVMRTGDSVMSADARADERFLSSETVVSENIVSLLCVPLVIKDRIGGAIYIDHRQTRYLFAKRDLDFLEAFADQAAIAIENARLYEELEGARARLSAENETLRNEVLAEKHLDSIVGHSEAVSRIQFTVKKAASSNATVLIRGESGTGKGLVARIIHTIGGRMHGPFIKFNCAALPESLAESELFGHEKGAFTGADRRKPGRFELADGGTIFLDEVGKINLAMQAKLLRVVEEKEFERVGGTQTIRTDVKIIAATNLNLEDAIRQGTFREDLYYRLNIIPVNIPALRERKEDLPDLVEHFVRSICRDLGIETKRLEPGVLEMFQEYDWPGNIRELEATIHRAIVMSSGDELFQKDFFSLINDPHNTIRTFAPPDALPHEVLHPLIRRMEVTADLYEDVLNRVDRQLIERALESCGGRIRETARRLGIARNTLKSKIDKYEIDVEG